MGPIDNNPALVQKMAWCRTDDKPLSEPMMAWFCDAYMRLMVPVCSVSCTTRKPRVVATRVVATRQKG